MHILQQPSTLLDYCPGPPCSSLLQPALLPVLWFPFPTTAAIALSAGLYGDVLKARALWLIGVCGSELQPGPWAEAFSLAVRHIQASDLVVSWTPFFGCFCSLVLNNGSHLL